MASMIKWLSKVNPSLKGLYPKPDDPFLPDPNLETSDKEARACSSANEAISEGNSPSSCGKRSPYQRYDDEQRAAMAKYADLHGLTAASRHFSVQLGRHVAYTTIQSIQRQYRKKLKTACL